MNDTTMRLRDDATRAGSCLTFTELAAVSLARQFLKKNRKLDARRILRSYMKRYPTTPRIAAAWALTA